MNKDDWKRVENELSHLYGRISLQCDQYRVTLVNAPTGPFSSAISVYVNGWFKGEYLLNDCEERRRFYRCSSKFVFPASMRKKIKKLPKRARERMGWDPDKKYTSYSGIWKSLNSMIRHLKANNQSIEIIDEQKQENQR